MRPVNYAALHQTGPKSCQMVKVINDCWLLPRFLHLDLSKHAMCNARRFCLRVHSLKVKAPAWLEGSSRVCDQCPDGEYEHRVQNEVHAFVAMIITGKLVRSWIKNNPFHSFLRPSSWRPDLIRIICQSFLFMYKLMNSFRDQWAADQPKDLAEGHPQLLIMSAAACRPFTLRLWSEWIPGCT